MYQTLAHKRAQDKYRAQRKQFQVVMTPEQHALTKLAASISGMSMSQFAIEAIIKHIENLYGEEIYDMLKQQQEAEE